MKRESDHLHYVPKQYAWYRDPSSSSSPDESDHLHYVPIQYAWYRDPSSSSSPDDKVAVLYKMPKSEKGDNSAKYLGNFTET